MQTQLDQARSALARQRHELDDLRARLETKEARLDEMLHGLEPTGDVEARLRRLDERGDELAEQLRARIEGATDEDRLLTLEARVNDLEEGPEMSRIRMRLERVGHTLRDALAHLATLEEAQRELGARVARREQDDARIARLESLFEELVQEQRARRDGPDVETLGERLDDLEAVVVATGDGERALRQTLERNTEQLEALRESITPPPAVPSASGDDLTRIKGIGPKFARLLAELGVRSFEAIAGWDEDDVARVAAGLGVKPARIVKAGWVSSARGLLGESGA